MQKVYGLLGSSRLISYAVSDGVSVSGFESGGTLLVNQGRVPVMYGDITIAPQGYAVVKEGTVVGQSE